MRVSDGEGAGSHQQVDLAPDVVASGVGTGDDIVVVRDAGAEGGATYSFYDYARGTPMLVLAVLFVLVVGAVARLRGLLALVGLGFAYAGPALPLLLLLFEGYLQPAGAVLTGSLVAEEVIRTLVGGIALVLAVPLTTAIGALVAEAADAVPQGAGSGLRARLAR